MRTLLLVLCSLAIAPLLSGAPPRIHFERVLPAAHDLGSVRELAVVASPATRRADVFVETFLEEVIQTGAVPLARDARAATGPADVHLDVKTLTCGEEVREGEGSVRNAAGERVKERYFVVDAVCTARVDVLSRVMRYRSTFYGRGAGSSPRVATVTPEAREHAILEAVRYAAKDAVQRITPRRVREAIVLEENAPAFESGMAMIEAGRLEAAREIWEAEVRQSPRSAALHFNLGALCEAMKDRRAAELHYTAARQLAPHETRYAAELKLFARRE